jgi:D-alanyl-lipoteichoic acid acyltransferase DltB (MBOAT superfamily)
MSLFLVILSLICYVFISRFVIKSLDGSMREAAFAFLNLAAMYGFIFYGQQNCNPLFILYLVLILFQFVTLRIFSDRGGWLPWLAFFTPITALIFFRYLPATVYERLGHFVKMNVHGVPKLIGLSYLAFRCSRLVLEVRNKSVEMPTLLQYLNFSFFFPTMFVGPINTYANYRRGFEKENIDCPAGRSALRILVGFIKFRFLGNLCNKLTYSGLLIDDHPHHWIDLPVAMVFFYLYLYCNFSGFCDMAIGAAGLIGISVPENFQDPFFSRNMREFWNRWHITLSQYMRDVVFSPLSKFFTRLFGADRINLAVSVTIMIVFLLIGIWHGPGWNYAIFGLLQGVGVIVTHFYTLGLKSSLGREGFRAYNSNRWIRAAAVAITFCYYSMTLFFFANTPEEIKEIFSVLR